MHTRTGKKGRSRLPSYRPRRYAAVWRHHSGNSWRIFPSGPCRSGCRRSMRGSPSWFACRIRSTCALCSRTRRLRLRMRVRGASIPLPLSNTAPLKATCCATIHQTRRPDRYSPSFTSPKSGRAPFAAKTGHAPFAWRARRQTGWQSMERARTACDHLPMWLRTRWSFTREWWARPCPTAPSAPAPVSHGGYSAPGRPSALCISCPQRWSARSAPHMILLLRLG